jgi:hypothetical protein
VFFDIPGGGEDALWNAMIMISAVGLDVSVVLIHPEFAGDVHRLILPAGVPVAVPEFVCARVEHHAVKSDPERLKAKGPRCGRRLRVERDAIDVILSGD